MLAHRGLNFFFSCAAISDFKVRSFNFDEGLSYLYCGQIVLSHARSDIRAEILVDKIGYLTIFRDNLSVRNFHGIIKSFKVGDTGSHYTNYEIELVPSLARSGLRHNSRIFQNQNVVTIVETLLSEMNINDIDFALKHEYGIREYCV